MSLLDDALAYLDLPKDRQDDDALTFARAVVSLYRLLDERKAEIERMRYDRCTCALGDGGAPMSKHARDCSIVTGFRKRIDPSVAWSRIAAALSEDEDDDAEELEYAVIEAAKALYVKVWKYRERNDGPLVATRTDWMVAEELFKATAALVEFEHGEPRKSVADIVPQTDSTEKAPTNRE